jgi:hypothetical protein
MRRVLWVGLVLAVLSTTAGAAAAARPPLRLPLHSRVTFTGQTLGSGWAAHTVGHVVATARWNSGAVYVFASPQTDAAGRWAVKFHPSNLGRYTVRILTPDGATLRYVFTVY